MPPLSFHDQQHIARMLIQEQRVNRLFNALIEAVSPELKKWNDSGRNNVWLRNGAIENNIDKRLVEFQSLLEAEIKSGALDAWKLSDVKNDMMVEKYIKNLALSNIQTQGMFARNLDAFEAFQNRVDNGMTLSGRVVNTLEGAKTQMEFYLKSGIGVGRSAANISQDIRQLMHEPDKRFHRIRDLNGKLVASQPMKNYHPGQGVYKSSYKNAVRIAATETNMAYHLADHERWKKLDFVLGYEVIRSGKGQPCAVCDALKGKYPKDFVFSVWHSFCICSAVPILMDTDDFTKHNLMKNSRKYREKQQLKGIDYKPTDKYIKDIPEGAATWIKEHEKAVGKSYWGEANKDILKAVEKPVKKAVSRIPSELMKGSEYLKGTSIEFKEEFFGLVNMNEPITLHIKKKGGAFYNPGNKSVNIENGARAERSTWEREAVIYHEFGHAIDWQQNLRSSEPIKLLMNKYRKLLSVKKERTIVVKQLDYANMKYFSKEVTTNLSEYALLDNRLQLLSSKIFRTKPEVFTKLGITKHDVLEQIGSTLDTIMALNPTYGSGHTKAYFKRVGAKEAEFIAHAFENKFATNRVFKKVLPELYKEMIQYIENLQ